MAQTQSTYVQILSDIKKHNFKPVYLLMGEEPYYIDIITNAIIDNALNDSERDFNQTIMYGLDADVRQLINAAKRYPMMSERQLIVVKEAQNLDKIEELIYYVKDLQPKTILVLAYKKGILKDKKLLPAIDKCGVVYESKKIYDDKLPMFITDYVSQNSLKIEPKAVSMLSDYIGTDLNRMVGELQKLTLILEKDKTITADIIEKNIGISKDYNNFELLRAIITKDQYKLASIIKYFEQDPKNNPLIVTISVLFNFFSNLLILYYTKDKSDSGIMREFYLRSIKQVRDYKIATTNYNVFKCVDIISYIREYDAKSKGVGVAPLTSGASLLRELVYKITH